jgi:CheY-like chemotaxis protein
MGSNLTRQLSVLGHGDHACLIYRTEREQMETVVPFIKEGLDRNERCAYTVHGHTVSEMTALLAAAGIDVRREQGRGALIFHTSREAYLPSGRFDLEERLILLSEYVGQAIASGFSGLRSAGEMGWVTCVEPGCERTAEYGARLNDLVPQLAITGLCQYDRAQSSPAILRDALRTHPIVVLDGKVRRNHYYEPPEMFLGRATDADRVEWMSGELKKAPEVTAGAPVLVVDDDQDIRRGMGRNLEARGYTVVKAEDVEEALDLAVQERPYFIFTNADLPSLDNLIYLIRREAGLRNVPVVAIYPDRPEEFREDRIVVLDGYPQLEELLPPKAA